MLRSFVKNHKFLTVCLTTAAASSTLLIKKENRLKFSDATERAHRTTYLLGNAGYLLFYYWRSFRHLESGTPEYEVMEHIVNERCAKRLFLICDHLGGYFAKFGQMMSSMGQGIPEEFIKELSKCQDNLTPATFSDFKRVIVEDLGKKQEDTFISVEDKPIGCASLAQVHRGVLKNGEVVAIKVQYPNVARNTQVDLRNMEFISKLASRLFSGFQYSWIVPKIRSTVENEFNFLLEVENMTACREFFEDNRSIYVPKAYPELSSKRMVVMEYIDGIKVNDITQMKENGFKPHEVGKLCLQAFSDMIFRFNRIHMDPHAGNLMVRAIPGTTDPQLVILDHGMYYRFSEGFNERYRRLWLAMIQQDKAEMQESCKPWEMEEYAEILAMMLTGRNAGMNRKLGEEMSNEEMEKMRERMKEEMQNRMKSGDKERMMKQMRKMQNMMMKMPLEMSAMVRMQMILSGVTRTLECSEYDRIQMMTTKAIGSTYRDKEGNVNYLSAFKWKAYLWLLRCKLFFSDLMIDWYYRWYLHTDSSIQLPF